MNTSPKFCRFCALSKPSNELFDLASSLALFEDVKNRLKLLGINYVNLNEEGLPKAICHSCYLNLKNCYHVFERIKDSQTALRQLFLQNEGTIVKEIPNCDIITQQGDFPFDFDCPRLKNVDESTRETVKTLALLALYDARWHQHDARTTQPLQNAGVQQQPQNLAIAGQQPLKPNQPTKMAVERPLSPKSKTKRIKDSILKDWPEVGSKDGEDEVDKKNKNTERKKRKHTMSLRYPAKDYLYYIPGDRRRCMK